MNASSPFNAVESTLETLQRIERELVERRNMYAMAIADYMRAIETVDAKIESIRNSIKLEELGPEIAQVMLPNVGAPTPGTTPAPIQSVSGNTTFSAPVTPSEPGNVSLSSRQKNIVGRWLAFVQHRLHTIGPTTVEALFSEAPTDLRNDFDAVQSTYSSLFRARRALRKSPVFEVDRSTGVVTMPVSAVPPMIAFDAADRIVTRIDAVKVADGTQVTISYEVNGLEVQVEYTKFRKQLYDGAHAWLTASDGSVVPLSAQLHMNKKSVISSYDENDWTDTFRLEVVEAFRRMKEASSETAVA